MSRTRKEKAKLAGRILLAGATGGGSEVARVKKNIADKAVSGISNAMSKGRARRQARRAKRRAGKYGGGEVMANKTATMQPKMKLGHGGSPRKAYGKGGMANAMPKAKPC